MALSLQPAPDVPIDRTTTAPFLLRCYWRTNRALQPDEFSVAPPADTTGIADYASILPASLRNQSVQIYTWPNCSLSELSGLLTQVLPQDVLPSPAVGTRLVYKLVFPDTRAEVREGGRGKWIDKPLGSVVIGTRGVRDEEDDGLEGDVEKTLGDARFVIGDYVACTIYPPGPDGRVAALPPATRPMRDGYGGRGPPPPRENGYGGDRGYGGGDRGYGGRGGGGYRGGYGGRGGGGFGGPPPPGDWRRGERPGYNGGGGGGYGRGRGRPY